MRTLYENYMHNELKRTVNIELYGNPTIHIFSYIYLCCHSRLIYLQQPLEVDQGLIPTYLVWVKA